MSFVVKHFFGEEMSLREVVVAEAESWIGTPFHHAARVKGAGIDCLMLLAEVYERAGIAPHIEPPFYVPDWHLHRDAERYLEGLTRYAREIAGPPQGTGPLPGDIALFRFGRTFSHGAIVTAWPRLIHAYWSIGVVRGDATLHPLAARPVRFFSPFEQCPSPRPSPRKRGEGELTAAGVHPSEPW
jgi:NlpC/P60 family putative phage cell wall peptidase